MYKILQIMLRNYTIISILQLRIIRCWEIIYVPKATQDGKWQGKNTTPNLSDSKEQSITSMMMWSGGPSKFLKSKFIHSLSFWAH